MCSSRHVRGGMHLARRSTAGCRPCGMYRTTRTSRYASGTRDRARCAATRSRMGSSCGAGMLRSSRAAIPLGRYPPSALPHRRGPRLCCAQRAYRVSTSSASTSLGGMSSAICCMSRHQAEAGIVDLSAPGVVTKLVCIECEIAHCVCAVRKLVMHWRPGFIG